MSLWKRKRELESCGICELASSGLSLKLTIDEETFYVGLKDLDNVLTKHKSNASVVRLVDVDSVSAETERGDSHGPLTSEIKQQIRHEAHLLNENET